MTSTASLRGRIGAYALHATHDPRETTAKARAAFLDRFLEGIPVDLPDAERERRALAARRAYFARLAYRSAVARSTTKKAATPAKVTAQEVSSASSTTPTP